MTVIDVVLLASVALSVLTVGGVISFRYAIERRRLIAQRDKLAALLSALTTTASLKTNESSPAASNTGAFQGVVPFPETSEDDLVFENEVLITERPAGRNEYDDLKNRIQELLKRYPTSLSAIAAGIGDRENEEASRRASEAMRSILRELDELEKGTARRQREARPT